MRCSGNGTLFIKNLLRHCQFSWVVQSVRLSDPMNHSTPGLPIHHQLLESTQTHVHWIGVAIQPSHLFSSPSLPVLNLSQYQGLFKCVSSLHQVAKVLELQLQHQSFQWIFRVEGKVLTTEPPRSLATLPLEQISSLNHPWLPQVSTEPCTFFPYGR